MLEVRAVQLDANFPNKKTSRERDHEATLRFISSRYPGIAPSDDLSGHLLFKLRDSKNFVLTKKRELYEVFR